MADVTREARERAEREAVRFGNWLEGAQARNRLTISLERFQDVVGAHRALLAELDAAERRAAQAETERDLYDARAYEAEEHAAAAEARVAVLEDALQEITKPLCQLGGRDRVQIANAALASAASAAIAQDAAPVAPSVLSSEASGVGNEPGTGAPASPKGDT